MKKYLTKLKNTLSIWFLDKSLWLFGCGKIERFFIISLIITFVPTKNYGKKN